jgi:hypothetical protein
LSKAAAVAAAFTAFGIFAQQELPPPLLGGPPSDVPVAVQVLRWRMLDSDVSALMFRSMDTLFTTRTVARSGPEWTLQRADRPLAFSYSWQGQTIPAEQTGRQSVTRVCVASRLRARA